MERAKDHLNPLLEPLARFLGLQERYGHAQGSRVVCAAFLSRDGGPPLLATAADEEGEDGKVRLWSPQPRAAGRAPVWREVQTLHGHDGGAVRGAAFLAPHEGAPPLLATAGKDATARLWRPEPAPGGGEEWREQQALRGHRGPVNGATFLVPREGAPPPLATAGVDATARLWRPQPAPGGGEKWHEQQALWGHRDKVRGAAFLAPHEGAPPLLATAGVDATARIWRPELAPAGGEGEWREVQALRGHDGWVNRTAFLAPRDCAPSLLATTGRDATARLWLPQPAPGGGEGEWQEMQEMKGHNKGIVGPFLLQVEGCGGEANGFLATASVDGTIILWRVGEDGGAYKAVHVRKATPLEVVLPLALTVVGVMQKVCLAFFRDLPWNQAAVRLVVVLQLAVLEFHVAVSPALQLSIRTACALVVVWAFLLCACLQVGAPVALAASTFLVMPLLKELLKTPDCSQSPAGAWMQCFHGVHVPLCAFVATTLVLYVLLLMPFTAAQGDLALVPRSIWLRPREWLRRKEAEARGLDLHSMRPRSDGALPNALGNLSGSMLLVMNGVFSDHDRCASPPGPWLPAWGSGPGRFATPRASCTAPTWRCTRATCSRW